MAGFSFGIIIAYMLTIASFYGEEHLYLYSLILSISTIVQPMVQTLIMLFMGFKLLFIFYLVLSLVLFTYSLIQRMEDKKEMFNLKLKVNYGIIISILITISYVTGFSVISTFLPVYLVVNKHLSTGIAYSIFIPFFASTVLSRTLLSTIKTKKLEILSSLSIILTALGFAILFEQTYIVDIIAAFILGISHGIIYPLASVYITRYSTANERNSYMSLYLLFRELSFSLIIYLFSFMNLGTQLTVSIILNLIILLIFFFFKLF
ncbi:MFS transporter [Stygiolobus azoricus]